MTTLSKKEAKRIVEENMKNTGFQEKNICGEYITVSDMHDMLRYRMQFGEAETQTIIASLVLAGAKFEK